MPDSTLPTPRGSDGAPSFGEMMASAEAHAGPWERVRRFYRVPARRGGRVTFSGFTDGDIHGRLTYCNGQYVWMRADDGRKIGPLHPTWELFYAV